MGWLIKLLNSVIKCLVVSSFLCGVPIYAKSKATPITATSYAVMDLNTGTMLKERNSEEVRSIASITKIMTAMVILDAGTDLTELVKVERIKGIRSRLQNNLTVPKSTLLHITLMSSDNLASKLLAKHYPGGEDAFIVKMNEKAQSLGMTHTQFTDPTGLLDTNISTAQDLIKLLSHAATYETILKYSTSDHTSIEIPGKKRSTSVNYGTTNSLVKKYKDIVISKTGWIQRSGGCLIMLVQGQDHKRAIIVLNSRNTHTRILEGDLLYGMYNNGKNF